MENDFFAYDNDKSEDAVRRYKKMLKEARTQYFDIHEFELIVDHYRSENRSDAALYALDIALKQHPSAFQLEHKRAEILLEKDEMDEAFALLKKLLAQNPNSTSLLLMLGVAYVQAGQAEKAKATFEAALEQHPTSEQGNVAYTVGINFERHQQFRFAIDFFEKALSCGLKNDMIYYDMGFCYEKLNLTDRSISLYQKHLEDHPFAADAWYNLGIAYGKQNEHDRAAEAYEYALAINPDYPSAIFNLANAYSSIGRLDEAVLYYEKYLDYDPDSEETLLYIGQCYDQQEKHRQAKDCYLRALAIDEKYADAYYALALNCFVQQEVEDSLFHIKKALRLNDKSADYWFAYGNIELFLGVVDKAIHAYEQTVDIDPTIEDAWLNLSEIFYNSGQYDTAASILEKAYLFNYDKASVNFRLAAYLLLQEDEKGVQHLEEGLQIDRNKLEEFIEWYPAYVVNDEVKHLLRLYQKD